MTKIDKLKQAEQMYIFEKQPINIICKKLNISRRILFYWKKEYKWDKKKFESENYRESFNYELLNFAQKFIQKISTDIDNKKEIKKSEYYSLLDILKNITHVKPDT
jgi:hypothetical protein